MGTKNKQVQKPNRKRNQDESPIASAPPSATPISQRIPNAGEILESITDGFFTLDRDWRFNYVNSPAAANLGLKPKDLIGQNIWDRFPKITGTDHELNYRKVMTGREPRSFEMSGVLTDKWYEIHVYPLNEGISVCWQDITGRKRTEKSLKDLNDELENKIKARTDALIKINSELVREINDRKTVEEGLRLQSELLNATTDVVYLRDSSGKLIYMNEAGSKLYDYGAEELKTMTVSDLMAPERINFVSDRTAEITEKKDITFETVHRRKDGTTFPVEIHSRLVDIEGQTFILGVIRDVTRRKKAEEELRNVPLRLLEAQERERHAIGRELFDQTGQYLTAIKLLLARMKMQPEMAETHITEAYTVVNELVEQIRNLSLDLRPPMLDNLGLLASLTWHTGRYSAATGITVTLSHDGLDRDFPTEVSTAAYRIVQEALLNAAKYAGVKEVGLRIEADDNNLRLQITDGGQGFDPAVLDRRKSTGLSIMRERTRLLGGRFDVETALEKGTRITVELPLKL